MRRRLLLVVAVLGFLAVSPAFADCPLDECSSVCQEGTLCSKQCCNNGDLITCGSFPFAPPCCQPNWVLTGQTLIAGFCSRSDNPNLWIWQEHYLFSYEDVNHCSQPSSYTDCAAYGPACTGYTTRAACCAAHGGCWGEPGCGDFDWWGCRPGPPSPTDKDRDKQIPSVGLKPSDRSSLMCREPRIFDERGSLVFDE